MEFVVADGGQRPRIVKAAAVRRRELIDCAQQLFLTKGYEQTSINEVILATGLSKGAFYHHFRSKEDLLEAITARFAQQALQFVESLETGLNALDRLNRLLALGRDWKREHVHELQPMFTTLLKPENLMLYHRIVTAAFDVLRPAIAGVVASGVQEGVFQPVDAAVAAEVMLSLSESRRSLVVGALALARTDPQGALAAIMGRVQAEETILDRILGLAPGSVQLGGPPEVFSEMLTAWLQSEASAP
jgi:AcrR family transcriptional regulator